MGLPNSTCRACCLCWVGCSVTVSLLLCLCDTACCLDPPSLSDVVKQWMQVWLPEMRCSNNSCDLEVGTRFIQCRGFLRLCFFHFNSVTNSCMQCIASPDFLKCLQK